MTASEAWRRSWALTPAPAETPRDAALSQGTASLPAPQHRLDQKQGRPSWL